MRVIVHDWHHSGQDKSQASICRLGWRNSGIMGVPAGAHTLCPPPAKPEVAPLAAARSRDGHMLPQRGSHGTRYVEFSSLGRFGFFFVGTMFEVIATETGALQFSMNDYLKGFGDNSSSFLVTVVATVSPNVATLGVIGLALARWVRRRFQETSFFFSADLVERPPGPVEVFVVVLPPAFVVIVAELADGENSQGRLAARDGEGGRNRLPRHIAASHEGKACQRYDCSRLLHLLCSFANRIILFSQTIRNRAATQSAHRRPS